MAKTASAKRYAQAIFELALEQDQLEPWATDLELVERVLQDDDFRALLKHADLAAADKTKAIDEVLRDIHPLVRNLISLLVSKGMVDFGTGLRTAYNDLLDEHLGRQRVLVLSAVELEPQELERITRYVSDLVKKEVIVSAQIDESILGGIVIEIGDRLLDGSTRARLDGLRNSMHAGVMATTTGSTSL